MKILNRFVQDDSGATAIEYGLIAALISVGIIGAVTVIGTRIATAFANIRDGLPAG
jgi:pilus assembly protein Flp/PilA